MIVAVANQKGGVGKTTTVGTLAYYLAQKKYKVITVDADPQGNLSSWMRTTLDRNGFVDTLIKQQDILKSLIVINHDWPGVVLLPGNTATAHAFAWIQVTQQPFDTFANTIKPLDQVADYVLIDLPPSRSTTFEQILFAADQVLVPTQLERHSTEGIALMAATAKKIANDHGKGPNLLGIIPNQLRRCTEHFHQLRELADEYGHLLWPPIPQSIIVAEATSYGLTVFTHAPTHKVTEAWTLVCARFLENTQDD